MGKYSFFLMPTFLRQNPPIQREPGQGVPVAADEMPQKRSASFGEIEIIGGIEQIDEDRFLANSKSRSDVRARREKVL